MMLEGGEKKKEHEASRGGRQRGSRVEVGQVRRYGGKVQ